MKDLSLNLPTILYHGTWKDYYNEIAKESLIRGYFVIRSEFTVLIDECLDLYSDEPELRKNAIFLTNDVSKTEKYHYVFAINVNELDIEKLYVADFHIANKIYNHIIYNKRGIKKLVKSYLDNFMTFNEFIESKEAIIIPEFLYFGDIPLYKTKTIKLGCAG